MEIDDIRDIVKTSNLKHIAIIMDGNRRWAKKRNMPGIMGHKQGVEALNNITRTCKNFGINYLTVYAFSTENWNRSKDEVSFLMDLFSKTIEQLLPKFIENDLKVTFIGSKENVSSNIINIMEICETETKNCSSLNLQIAFNYGARAEIVHAVKSICNEVNSNKLQISDITEEIISNHLFTKNIPDPDLLIRTGGEKRISNYLLWQCAYSEIYVTETFWPDFNEYDLIIAIENFKNRQRRFGA